MAEVDLYEYDHCYFKDPVSFLYCFFFVGAYFDTANFQQFNKYL